jgi:glycosyltransferase involved in cell wall biosynthesis
MGSGFPMKNSILFLTNAYPDFDSSYRGIFIKKMAELLHADGYEISVVTPRIYAKSRYYEQQNGIKVYRFPFLAKNKLLIEYKKTPYLRMILYCTAGFFLTIYAASKNRCNVIHAHWAIPTGLVGVCVGALLRKPLIVTIHGSDLRMALERPGLIRKCFIYVSKNSIYVNCVSEVQKKQIKQLGIMGEKISVIPMGVDEAFLEIGKNRKFDSNKRPFTILSNRNLLPIYNVSLLIRAIPMILKEEPKTQFFIAGDGLEKEYFNKEVKNLNLTASVHFLGRVPHKEMPNLLAQSDIYVSTSPCDGTSVSLLEALASGAFPVVTDIPSNRGWIADGDNGFLVPKENENILAKKIIAAIRNHSLLREAGEKNPKIVKQRAYWSENIKKITKLYQYSA